MVKKGNNLTDLLETVLFVCPHGVRYVIYKHIRIQTNTLIVVRGFLFQTSNDFVILLCYFDLPPGLPS